MQRKNEASKSPTLFQNINDTSPRGYAKLIRDFDGATYNACWNAVTNNDVVSIKNLIEKDKLSKYLHTQNFIHLAVSFGSIDVLKLLLNSKSYKKNQLGNALSEAASKNDTLSMMLLFDTKDVTADVTLASKQTPLMCAASFGNVAACRLLIAHNADPSVKHEIFNQTAIDFAREKGHEKIVEILTQYNSVYNSVSSPQIFKA